MTNAGTQIGVASTKAFTTQLTKSVDAGGENWRLKGSLDASIEHDIVYWPGWWRVFRAVY